MAPIIKQTNSQKQLSFSKLLIIICGALFLVNISIKILTKINPMAGTMGGLIVFAGAIGMCFLIIYRNLAHYNYRIIDDELIMERVFSRANHMFLSTKIHELELFLPYNDFINKGNKDSLIKIYKFVLGKNKEAWYVGEFTRSGDRYRFIIEPNEEILKAITSHNNN